MNTKTHDEILLSLNNAEKHSVEPKTMSMTPLVDNTITTTKNVSEIRDVPATENLSASKHLKTTNDTSVRAKEHFLKFMENFYKESNENYELIAHLTNEVETLRTALKESKKNDIRTNRTIELNLSLMTRVDHLMTQNKQLIQTNYDLNTKCDELRRINTAFSRENELYNERINSCKRKLSELSKMPGEIRNDVHVLLSKRFRRMFFALKQCYDTIHDDDDEERIDERPYITSSKKSRLNRDLETENERTDESSDDETDDCDTLLCINQSEQQENREEYQQTESKENSSEHDSESNLSSDKDFFVPIEDISKKSWNKTDVLMALEKLGIKKCNFRFEIVSYAAIRSLLRRLNLSNDKRDILWKQFCKICPPIE